MPSTELRDLRALLLHRDRSGSDADVGTKRAAKHRVGEWPSTRHPVAQRRWPVGSHVVVTCNRTLPINGPTCRFPDGKAVAS
ncbi:MAG: hypothetical protein DMF88_21610 [Acidobacteria bacterium]|nr:MAG: hypothetical protein DMF88_21610 [Acidobacteriota bacterium]